LLTANPTAWFENLAKVSGLVVSLGKFNFVMSDGEHLIAHGHDRLHYLERPSSGQFDSPPVNSVLVATEPLDQNEKWTAFEPGELRVYLTGRIVGRTMTQPMSVAGKL
jgi:predicted glutamine amidotransferase